VSWNVPLRSQNEKCGQSRVNQLPWNKIMRGQRSIDRQSAKIFPLASNWQKVAIIDYWPRSMRLHQQWKWRNKISQRLDRRAKDAQSGYNDLTRAAQAILFESLRRYCWIASEKLTKAPAFWVRSVTRLNVRGQMGNARKQNMHLVQCHLWKMRVYLRRASRHSSVIHILRIENRFLLFSYFLLHVWVQWLICIILTPPAKNNTKVLNCNSDLGVECSNAL
jgi:hypothetical protein